MNWDVIVLWQAVMAALIATGSIVFVFFLTRGGEKRIMERFDKVDKKLEKLDSMDKTLKKILAVLERQYGKLESDDENPPVGDAKPGPEQP